MHWYWKVRIYNTAGDYAIVQIATPSSLRHIDIIEDFYKELTGCKMLFEGMSQQPYDNMLPLKEGFDIIWKRP